ncbi:hypothetical protein UFOVP1264_62 [uncultured Caudovirales phage]|uniref:Uncharacterized protein n=1 Tax=uncultured Caudovirales phage TaxID=2100421 RepID=A0A6J5RK78_9CAUD|nr:hypothetical protein UFOVP1264_62 [uncultured Caudovirales phage]
MEHNNPSNSIPNDKDNTNMRIIVLLEKILLELLKQEYPSTHLITKPPKEIGKNWNDRHPDYYSQKSKPDPTMQEIVAMIKRRFTSTCTCLGCPDGKAQENLVDKIILAITNMKNEKGYGYDKFTSHR